MDYPIKEIADRLRGMRIMQDVSPEEMARVTDVPVDEYLRCESGESDFSFTFLFKCAQYFGVDIAELVLGERPHLSFYSVVKKGEGLRIERREGFLYQHLAAFFKNRTAEPFVVTAPYREAEQTAPIHLSTHAGQEFDYVLRGSLKVQLGSHIETLSAGDSVYYDSGHPHGMIAVGGEPCEFLAVVLRDDAAAH